MCIMNGTYTELENLLKTDERFVSQDGKVMRNAVYEAANKMDEKLLALLIGNPVTKKMFFKEVAKTLIFDKQEFNFVISNQEMLPDSYTAYKQDIGLIDSKNDFISSNNDVVLSFPFKDCVLEFDSTDPDQKREEVFINEVLGRDEIDHLFEKKVLTAAKLINKDGEKEINIIPKDSQNNLLIKGNNLFAMYSLLPQYKGRIKFMYWDILYNTDSDKVPYADSFKHSSWLTMMKNRLEIARQLLKNDGVICLQCDDNEMAYLKVLMDEIFGRDKLVNLLVVEMASTGGLKRSHKDLHFLKTKEYILIYYNNMFDKLECLYDEWQVYDGNYTIYFDEKNGISKLKDKIAMLNSQYKNLQETGYLYFDDIYEFLIKNRNSIYRRHNPSTWAKQNFDKGIVVWKDENKKTRNEVVKVFDNNNEEYEYLMKIGSGEYERLEPLSWNYFDNKFKLLRGDIWKNYYKDMGNANKQGGVKLSGGKKPERLLEDLIKAFTRNGDVVLDAYFGTGTTGAVAMKMGRKFIGIEQLDTHVELAKTRLKNVINGDQTGISKSVNWQGGGEFVYCELKKLNQNFIDEINKAKTKESLIEIWERMHKTGFINCFVNIDSVGNLIENVVNIDIDEIKKILINTLDKNQLYVNYSDMDDEDFKVSASDKEFTNSFYGINNESK